jgi:hypothetical protein
VHALTHPTAKLERRERDDGNAEHDRPELAKTSASADELFSRLAAEDDDAESDDGTALREATLDGTVAPPARRSRSGQRLA